MSTLDIARAVHVLALVWWLGGVAMMTTIIAPVLRNAELDASRRRQLLVSIRRRFVSHARIALLLIGASGFGMLWHLGGLDRLAMSADGGRFALMLVTWSFFVTALFVLEPLGLMARLSANPRVFMYFQSTSLGLALITVAIGTICVHSAH